MHPQMMASVARSTAHRPMSLLSSAARGLLGLGCGPSPFLCPASGAYPPLPPRRLGNGQGRWIASSAASPSGGGIDGVVDLRSDTVTKPTPGMLEAMARAQVGDDVYGEDPTVLELQSRVAAMLGFEAGLWVPSGTMANVACVLSVCGRGDQVIVGDASHVWLWEQGGLSSLGGVSMHPIANNPRDGTLPIDAIRGAVQPDDDHLPRTRMVLLENTQSGCGGVPLPPGYTEEVAALCREGGMRLHVDGARLLNAAVALGVDPADAVRGADSACVCLSKGLGAPGGSIVAGSSDLVTRARRVRKVLGGGMRQVGVLAAAGLFALDSYREVMARDHRRARRLAEGLGGIGGVRVKPEGGGTNMVIFSVDPELLASEALCERLEERGVLIWPYGRRGNYMRAVLHHQVSDEGVERAVWAVGDALRRG